MYVLFNCENEIISFFPFSICCDGIRLLKRSRLTVAQSTNAAFNHRFKAQRFRTLRISRRGVERRSDELSPCDYQHMAVARIPAMVLESFRCESTDSGGGFGASGAEPATFRLSLSKPSWIIKSESNVRKEVRKKPNPPCVVCQGSGRVECHGCCGKGRTNHVDLSMLPKGVWPKWCKTCRGSGLSHCARCLGTGEYRYVMGFQFMKREVEEAAPNGQVGENPKQQRSAVDLLLTGDYQVPKEDNQLNGTPRSSTLSMKPPQSNE